MLRIDRHWQAGVQLRRERAVFTAGRNDFILAFSENDPAVLDPICAALGG
jgi:hypothetical protein